MGNLKSKLLYKFYTLIETKVGFRVWNLYERSAVPAFPDAGKKGEEDLAPFAPGARMNSANSSVRCPLTAHERIIYAHSELSYRDPKRSLTIVDQKVSFGWKRPFTQTAGMTPARHDRNFLRSPSGFLTLNVACQFVPANA